MSSAGRSWRTATPTWRSGAHSAGWRRTGEGAPAPAGLVPTRLALHRLAEDVISPARRNSNGKIGLRYTRGGFGTPFFDGDAQVRTQGGELVVVEDGAERRDRITSLAAAAELVGPALLPDGPSDDRPLEVDGESAAFLGDWFGFACSVLEELRAQADAAAEPSRVQLWPEHFDVALELGSEQAGVRAAYGLSPGDEDHPEPYAYVAPWSARPTGELWQAGGFPGAELSYAQLLEAEDQRGAALQFFRARADALAAGV